MSDRQISKVTGVLISARNYLSDINHWCPEGVGNDGLNVREDGVEQRCAYVAISREARVVCPDEKQVDVYGKAANILARSAMALCEVPDATLSHAAGAVIKINSTSHDKVMEMFDKAITLSMEEAKVCQSV